MPRKAPKRASMMREGAAPRLRFPVTAEMIEKSKPNDSGHCMVALGLKAAIPHAAWVTADLATIRFTDIRTGMRYIYLTPASAQVALLDFDDGVLPEPFDVTASAAQIVEPKKVREARTKASPGKRQKATVSRGSSKQPVKVGGKAPKVGALRGGHTGRPRARILDKDGNVRAHVRTGRVRSFGLREMATRRGAYSKS